MAKKAVSYLVVIFKQDFLHNKFCFFDPGSLWELLVYYKFHGRNQVHGWCVEALNAKTTLRNIKTRSLKI